MAEFNEKDAETIREWKNVMPKGTNPKDAIGVCKWRQFTTIPFAVLWEIGVAMLEGARKYGRHNYRVIDVRASVYIDAAIGHITQWFEGEDIDPDSGLNHLSKAIASLVVIRDAMIRGSAVDDRPPKVDIDTIRNGLQDTVNKIMTEYPNCVEPYTQLGEEEKNKEEL